MLVLATLAMLGLSWPLWVRSGTFPRVPFVAGFPEFGVGASWALFAGLIAAMVSAAFGRFWRGALGLSLFLLVVLFLQDQHRLQPWAYQYFMIGFLLVGLPPDEGLRYVRWWFAALYLHSGLSKLDVSFCDELGLRFLTGLLERLGMVPVAWPTPWRAAAVLALPIAEIVVAVLLCIPRLRRWGLAGAWILHAGLLLILGPWGLGHSPIVLVWNAAMMVEVWVLFGSRLAISPAAPEREARLAPVAKAVFWVAVVLPLGERLGLLDAWPAHALYASHVERTTVELHEDELDDYPPAIRRHVGPAGPWGWCRLDLTDWSRAERGVPVYPSARTCNGVAEALAARYRGARLVRLIQWGKAERWTGRRDRIECLGLDAIRRQGDRYWLNAHPARR